jgi:hypothetical protein
LRLVWETPSTLLYQGRNERFCEVKVLCRIRIGGLILQIIRAYLLEFIEQF